MTDIAALGYQIDSSDAIRAATDLDKMNAAAGRAAGGADVVAAASGNATRGLARFSNQGRMVALQLNQVTQQGLATGQWAQAFAIQAGDIALAFGAVGAAVGIVLPLVINLGTNFLSATGSVNTFKDAMSALREETAAAEDELAMLRLGLASLEQLKVQRQINDLERERRQIMSDMEDMSNRQARNARGRLSVIDELIASAEEELAKSKELNTQIELAEEGIFGIRDALDQVDWSGAISQATALKNVIAEAAGNAWSMAQARASIESGQFELGLGAQAYGGAQAAMREQMNIFEADGTVLPIPKTRGSGGGGGGGSAMAGARARDLEAFIASLQTEREALEAWRVEQLDLLAQFNEAELASIGGHEEAKLRIMQEYQERMAEIRGGYHGTALMQTETFMGDMAAALAGGNEKMARIGQAFASVEALINAYRAYNQVLADPSLPWFAKIPAAVSVLAAGLKTVQSIKSIGSSGSSSGGSSSAPSGASSSTAAPDPERVVRISVQGEQWMKDMVEGLVTQIYEASSDGARVIVER